jgi:hypothetical protein
MPWLSSLEVWENDFSVGWLLDEESDYVVGHLLQDLPVIEGCLHCYRRLKYWTYEYEAVTQGCYCKSVTIHTTTQG